MISCTNNQEGVDIVLPICLKNANLSPTMVTAILIQVKNAEKYQCKIMKMLFDGMNPIQLGLFNQAWVKPVIRIVFALASVEPAVLFPDRPTHRKHPNSFTAFDIWCAGLSLFNNNTKDDLSLLESLLYHAHLPCDKFKLDKTKDKHLDDKTKLAREGQRWGMAALTMLDVGHRRIHEKNSMDKGQDVGDSMDKGQDIRDGMDEGQGTGDSMDKGQIMGDSMDE